MRRRQLHVVAAACLVLGACGTSDAASPEAPSTVGDVGVLPGTLPAGPTVPSTDVPATSSASTAPVSTTAESAPPTTPRVNDGRVSVGRLAGGNRVLVIGDSILASISDRYGGQLCAELVPRGWVVEVDAEVGRFVEFGRQVLERRPVEEWDVAVVMLGNNYDGDPEGFGAELGLLLDGLEPLPVVLLNVTPFEPAQDAVNWIVGVEAGRRDDVLLVDWARPTAADTPGSDELLTGDGLHLTTSGQQALAERIRRALGRAPGDAEGACLRSTFRDDSNGSLPHDVGTDEVDDDGANGPAPDGTAARPGRATTTTAPARGAEPDTTAAPNTTSAPDRDDADGPAEPAPPAGPPPATGPDATPAP